jgi:AMP nucleosidase
MIMEADEILEEEFAKETLERYSGSPASAFQSNLLITNFPQYVDHFGTEYKTTITEGGMFRAAHSEKEGISILDFKIGSPAAALVVDLCSFLPVKAALLLGMCGGLRRRYKIGEYLVPIASIRAEGTSDFYFPAEVPSLANFLMQKAVTEVLERTQTPYHIGITYTSNLRFWEYNEPFIAKLKATRAQAFELECATLFTASYKRKLTLGAILLISDLPLNRDQIKTKKSSEYVFQTFMPGHIQKGVEILKHARVMQSKRIKGSYHKNVE